MIRQILTWLRAGDKCVLAWRDLSAAPMDDPGLWRDGRVGEPGASRLATVTRFPEPDKAKLSMRTRKADVVRIDSRRKTQ